MRETIKSYKAFYDDIANICSKATVYKYTGLRPPHFVINCESDYEKRAVLQYIVDEFETAEIMDFSLAADKYLYFSFDGTLQQLRNTFSQIQSCAITSNHYSYILGLDIVRLIPHYSETQGNEFYKKLFEVSKHATCIFFIPSVESLNTEKFVAKICETVKQAKRINVPKFTHSDLAVIAVNRLKNELSVECTATFELAFSAYLKEEGITGIYDCIDIVERLLLMADYTTIPPKLNGMVFEQIRDKEDIKTKGDIIK